VQNVQQVTNTPQRVCERQAEAMPKQREPVAGQFVIPALAANERSSPVAVVEPESVASTAAGTRTVPVPQYGLGNSEIYKDGRPATGRGGSDRFRVVEKVRAPIARRVGKMHMLIP
jgi:hypothetical protein